ncbi:acyl carrier protein [Streptomyces californicus]|uniref:acyl carrier protein n=1 Tax=Streptomyces californicus TaxID=67351 RepID=UPI0037150E38
MTDRAETATVTAEGAADGIAPGPDPVEEAARAWWIRVASPDGAPPAPDADFFAVGCTSLQAVMVTGGISEDLDEEVPVRLLLQNSRYGAFVTALRAFLATPDDEAADPGRPAW